ncbi:MAG: dienelactone hydrolase family protein [Pontiella sp.]|nr:dienelactone hydrolase family protein [Pontiella sp.]NNJ70788.1 alpha/beta hydrolase [Kiritimatiellales bacterium]
MNKVVFWMLVLFGALNGFAADKKIEQWAIDLHEANSFEEMPYRLLKPLGFDAAQSYPVIVSLHGAGGKGADNIKQLRKWNEFLAEEQIRKDYPCYVLAPQSNQLWGEAALAKIKAIIKDLPSVDVDRIYITGHSMGGHGTYILTQLDPGYFAAAAPSAGSGLASTKDFVDVEKIKDIPFWVFHGDADPKCPYEKDVKIFEDMKRVGGNMKFTTWVGDKHGGPVALKMFTGSDNGITQVSGDRCDPEPVFMKWFFSQKRNSDQ